MRRRQRTALLTIAITAALLLTGGVAASGAQWYRTADFFCIWNGARLTASGADPYDEQTWRSATGGVHPDPFRGSGRSACAASYAYPLWTAIATLPFGVLPLEPAATLWMTISIGGVVGGMRLLWRAVGGGAALAPVFAGIVVASQPFWILLIGGQLTGVLLALIGVGAWSLTRGHQTVAGVALGSLLLKPQIAGFFLPAIVIRAFRSRPRVLWAAAFTALAFVVASLVVRPGWIAEWTAGVGSPRLRILELLPTAWGASADLLGSPLWAPILIASLALVVAALFRGRSYGTTTLAAAVLPLSLLAAPHVWSYDFLVLALPWAVALALAGRMTRLRRALVLILTIGAASLLPWSLYAVAFSRGRETWSAAVPAASALLVGIAVALGSRTEGRST